jgi:hypothetical protein
VNDVIHEREDGRDRRRQKCRCCVCKEVHTCTPSFDYYVTPQSEGFLVCERCFQSGLHNRAAHAAKNPRNA